MNAPLLDQADGDAPMANVRDRRGGNFQASPSRRRNRTASTSSTSSLVPNPPSARSTCGCGSLRCTAHGFGKAMVITLIVAVCCAMPVCIWQLKEKGAENHIVAWFTGGVFAIMVRVCVRADVWRACALGASLSLHVYGVL